MAILPSRDVCGGGGWVIIGLDILGERREFLSFRVEVDVVRVLYSISVDSSRILDCIV